MTLAQSAGLAWFLASLGFVVRYALLNPDVGLWPKVEGPRFCLRFHVRRREVCLCLLSWDIVVRTSLLIMAAVAAGRGWHLAGGRGQTDAFGAVAAWALAGHSVVFALNLLRQRQPLWLTRLLCWLRVGATGRPVPSEVAAEVSAVVGGPEPYALPTPRPPDI